MGGSVLMENNKEMKYQYGVLTWGGFYNEEFVEKHGLEEGTKMFDTKDERNHYLSKLKGLSRSLNARELMVDEFEGYNCNEETVLHRVISFDGKEHYTNYNLGSDYPYTTAQYHLENKWYPGFNDYPLGEYFDYSKVTIIQEWITGAFTQTLNKR